MFEDVSNLEYFRGVLDNYGISEPRKYIRSFGITDNEIDNSLSSNEFEIEVLAGIVAIKVADGESIQELFRKTPSVDIGSFTGKNWQHNEVGNYIIKHHHACIINGGVHVYRDGVYIPGEDPIHQIVLELDETATANKRNEVYQYIKQSPKTPKKEMSPPNLIPFRSKIYDLDTDQEIEYSPQYVFFNRMPYDYRADAERQPLVDKMLNDIAQSDADIIKLFYEVIGYCFYRQNRYRCCVILFGESGCNGKSTFLNMVRQAIGDTNCSSLSLQDTTEKFRIGELYGKLANIGDDIPAKVIEDSSLFKKICTGEIVYFEKKGKDAIPFVNYAKPFFACNELPPAIDKSDALLSRFKIIPLNADFSETSGKCNTSLKNRIWTTAEMEYVIHNAMNGLKRLLANNGFTKPACMSRALLEYRTENDTVLSFIDEKNGTMCFVGKPVAEVFEEFKDFLKRGNYKPMTITTFGKRFRKITKLIAVAKSVRMTNGALKTVKVYDFPTAS